MTGPRVLDPCCGGRMMWLDRRNQDVIFGDCRSETIVVTDRSNGNTSGTRTLRIEPDTLLDFRALPYSDGYFKLVAFDPPHLHTAGPKSWMAAKYGKLSDNWQDDLRRGFVECFRVLDPDGVLIFKWNETQVKVGEVLALVPVKPLFGHISGRKGLTHWLVFMKPKRCNPSNKNKLTTSSGVDKLVTNKEIAMTITVEQVIEKYIETRDAIEAEKKLFDAKVADLKALQENREKWLMGALDKMGATSMKAPHGTVFIDWKDSATVADAGTFLAWVHEDWDERNTFLENRVSKTAVKQRLEDGQTPPPGVNYTKVKDVKVRRA